MCLAGQSAAASALWPLISGCRQEPRQSPAECIDPISDTEHTLAAFVDAVVPGFASDPEHAPGALDACGLNVVLDPRLPLAPMADLMCMALDAAARSMFGARLVELDVEARIAVLAEAEATFPELNLAMRLVRTAFYGSQFNDIAAQWLGFPGPNLGYLDEGFSFGRAMSEEMTDDGNLP